MNDFGYRVTLVGGPVGFADNGIELDRLIRGRAESVLRIEAFPQGSVELTPAGGEMGKLVLSRRPGEQVVVPSASMIITPLQIKPGQIRLAFDAPKNLTILRKEILDQIAAEAKSDVSGT